MFGDGDLRVSFAGQSWTFNPACLTAYQREEDANFMTTEDAKESKSEEPESRLSSCLFNGVSPFPLFDARGLGAGVATRNAQRHSNVARNKAAGLQLLMEMETLPSPWFAGLAKKRE